MREPGRWERCLDQEATDPRRTGPQVAAGGGGALAHPEEAMASGGGVVGDGRGGRSWTVVPDADVQRVGGVVELHVDGCSGRVPAGIGECLLDDPVRGELDARVERCDTTTDDEACGRGGPLSGVVDQLDDLVQARLGLARRVGVRILA